MNGSLLTTCTYKRNKAKRKKGVLEVDSKREERRDNVLKEKSKHTYKLTEKERERREKIERE